MMKDEHVDNFSLERLCADDLPEALSLSAMEHLRDCERCASFVEQTKEFLKANLVSHPSSAFLHSLAARTEARSWRRWFRVRWLMPAMAAAGAAAVMLLPILSPSLDTQLKGGALSVHRYRADASTLMNNGERVRVGDRIEILAHGADDAVIVFVPDDGKTVPLGNAHHGVWFVMEEPCTPGWIRVRLANGEGPSMRVECEP